MMDSIYAPIVVEDINNDGHLGNLFIYLFLLLFEILTMILR
jgi:hypothetical protein